MESREGQFWRKERLSPVPRGGFDPGRLGARTVLPENPGPGCVQKRERPLLRAPASTCQPCPDPDKGQPIVGLGQWPRAAVSTCEVQRMARKIT